MSDEVGTVSHFRWNKKGEIQKKICEFSIFFQSEDKMSGSKPSKKGSITIIDQEYDMSQHASEEQEEVTMTFAGSKKQKSFQDSKVTLAVKFHITQTEKDVDPTQLETRA